MATWTYPATNRLLFQAGVSLRQDRQFNGVPPETGDAIPVLDQSSGVAYGSRFVSTTIVGDTEYGDMGNQYAYQTRASMSYITGSHNFKVGMQTMNGNSEIRSVAPLYDFQYIIRQGVAGRAEAGRVSAPAAGQAEADARPLRAGSVDAREAHAQSRCALRRVERVQPGADPARRPVSRADQFPGGLRRAELEGHQSPARGGL